MLVLLLLLVSAAEFSLMNSVPVVRTSWEPRTQVDASYAKLLDHDEQGFTGTDFTFFTTRPTIRLANFLQITHVGCTPDQLALVFDSKDSADKAFNSWSGIPDFTVIVPHEAHCNGDKAVSLVVHGMEQQNENILMHIEHGPLNQVIKEWNVVVNQYQLDPAIDQTLVKRGFISWIKKVIRNMVDGIKNAGDQLKKVGDAIARPIQSTVYELQRDLSRLGEAISRPFRFHKDKSKLVKMNINYNETTDGANHRNMTVFDTRVIPFHVIPPIGLFCIDCYSKGYANIQVELKGTMALITHYDISLNGDFFLNADYDMVLFKVQDQNIFKLRLFSLPLTPFIVPGILTFGPELQLNSRLHYGTDANLNLRFGYDIKFPFNWRMKSDKGMLSIPEVTGQGKPSLVHHKFDPIVDKQVRIMVSLVPTFALVLNLVETVALDVHIGFDTALGVETSTGNFTRCPAEKVNVKLFEEHALRYGFKVHVRPVPGVSKNFDIWRAPRNPIACFNCDKCPQNGTQPSTVSGQLPPLGPPVENTLESFEEMYPAQYPLF